MDAQGHVQTCELFDDTRVNAGWDVMVLLDGEPQFSRRCPDVESARYLATAMKQDGLRCGWREQPR
jgi:hypothetical protein